MSEGARGRATKDRSELRIPPGSQRVYTTPKERPPYMHPTSRPACQFWRIAALFALAATMHAQVSGSILGSATDSSRAAVPGVVVRVVNVDTNLNQEARTDPLGQYRFLALPAGRYRLEASLQGFQKFVADEIVLTINEQHRVDVIMQVGSLEQQVEVQANTVQVETTNTQLGQVIDDKKMINLPLNGRSYLDLLALQPGVVGTNVNGQRSTANSFMVNGGDVGLGNGFTAGEVPNLDSVAEFRLITNSFDAEYGRFSGSVVNALTKAGTNSIHGSAFEFLRNQRLDARGIFDPKRADLKRNQFGYAVGGPLLHNKVFWFTDYQGTREIQGVGTGLILVPTLQQRQGILSPANFRNNVNGSYWANILSQRLGYTVTAGQPYSSVFPGGVIPQRAFSPTAVNLLKYIGEPNQGPNYYATSSANRNNPDDKAGQRVDVNNRRVGNFFAYYHFDEANAKNPLGGSTYGGFPNESPKRTQQGVLNHIYVFGPSAVNEARVSFFRNATYTNLPGDPSVPLKSLGFVTGDATLGIVPAGPAGWRACPTCPSATSRASGALRTRVKPTIPGTSPTPSPRLSAATP